jgi:FkbM family methyltransferase
LRKEFSMTDRTGLQGLHLAQEGAFNRFSAANADDATAVASLLRDWARCLRLLGSRRAFEPVDGLSVHQDIVRFLASVKDIAGGDLAFASPTEVGSFASKCREHFSYFESKCEEHGANPLTDWNNGITFAKTREDSRRVLSDVTREMIDHLLNHCADDPRMSAPDGQALERRTQTDEASVRFIKSEDDSRKPRGYYYYGKQTAMVETHFDAHLLLDLCDLSLTPTILKTGWWEPWIDILLRSLLKPGMTYVNAGANVGYHTALGAKLVESNGRVFSFEANPHVYSLLKKSVFFNGFSERTTLYNAAVLDASGDADFFFVREQLGGGGLFEPKMPENSEADLLKESFRYKMADYAKVPVRLVTLDDTLESELDRLDLLHMDIEGAEGPALLGARALISRSPALRIIMEWSASEGGASPVRTKMHEAMRFLSEENFRVYVIRPPGGNVYTTPPTLTRIDPEALFGLGHCDLFLARG